VHVVVGSSTYDVTTRALVVGLLDGPASADHARRLVAAGADVLEVVDSAQLDAVRAAVDIPVVGPGEVTGVVADDAGSVAVAIARGARVVSTRDVHAARRVADVLAAVIDAGGPSCR